MALSRLVDFGRLLVPCARTYAALLHLPLFYRSLDRCGSLVWLNEKISSVSIISSFTTESLKEEIGSSVDSSSRWSWINEPVGISKADSFSKFGLVEQVNTIGDRMLWLLSRMR
ncbi:beta-galactosidase 8-like isoform X1 [Vigna unguiculata]|uniref:beta-galactosidase 8-like isoform X1 n=1 Tax=Vigna unguiculata TaxID=3917 RepID=UPI001015E4A3|nr:beta-galactosidase 8-like isoform X1 [Vigna unguiculata]